MASLKSVFLLFSVVLISQTQGATLPLKDDTNLLDVLRKALYQAELLIEVVLSATDQIINRPNDFGNIQEKFVEAIAEINTDIADELIKELEIVAKDSSIIGPKLPECVQASEYHIVGVIASFTRDYTTCIKEDLIKHASSFQSLVDSLVKMHEEDVTISKELDNCEKIDISGIACIAKVVVKVARNIISKVPELLTDVVPVIPEFSAFAGVAIQCAKDTVPTLLANEKEIINQIASCNNA